MPDVGLPQQVDHYPGTRSAANGLSGDTEMRVSHETIYLSLYVQTRGALRKELTRYLRPRHTTRRPRGHSISNGQGQLRGTLHISQRPAEVEDRAVPGHWQGDLLYGKRMTAIATLVERHRRFVMLVELPNGHSADVVADALARHITALPEQLRRSLTWDHGKEMAAHARFSVATDVPVYFCDPRSPWQRGSNQTPTDCYASTSPNAATWPPSPHTTSTPSPPNSTDALDKPSAG
jgi:transposase, IS30 family